MVNIPVLTCYIKDTEGTSEPGSEVLAGKRGMTGGMFSKSNRTLFAVMEIEARAHVYHIRPVSSIPGPINIS